MEKSKTNKLLIGLLVFSLLLYGFKVINEFDENSREVANPEYQKYIEEYRQDVQRSVQEQFNKASDNESFGLVYQPSISERGTAGNFEGPQVLLEGVRFHDEFLTKKDSRLKHIDGLSAVFDPDHAYFGLPDISVKIQDVRLYEPEKGNLSQLLNFGKNSEPKPYKVYKKRLMNDSTGMPSKVLEMQLWLTEFKVTVDVLPDRENPPVKIRNEEKETVYYPGYWYGSAQRKIFLKDLKKEFNDNRYGDLSFVLKILPNNSPIYLKTDKLTSEKADFAIGAVYCSQLGIHREEDKANRIALNVQSGQPIFLNYELDLENPNQNPMDLPSNMEAMASKVMAAKEKEESFIGNKPYYMQLFFKNIGSWKEGFLGNRKYDDQVNFTFLMPMFVVGSWDIIPPQEILPEWQPPKPYFKEFTVGSLLPSWGLGKFGKVVSIALLFVIGGGMLLLFVPGLAPILLAITGRLRGKKS